MFKKIFILAALWFNISHAQTVDVPEGVVYKYANDKINEKAKAVISSELKKPTYKTYNVFVYMGPNLRNRYKNIPEIENITGNLKLTFPIYNAANKIIRQDTLIGKFIQSKDDFKIVWGQLMKEFQGKKIEFRKPTKEELIYYWNTIFFDIEEPIYVIEVPGFKLLIDISSKNKIEWIEELL